MIINLLLCTCAAAGVPEAAVSRVARHAVTSPECYRKTPASAVCCNTQRTTCQQNAQTLLPCWAPTTARNTKCQQNMQALVIEVPCTVPRPGSCGEQQLSMPTWLHQATAAVTGGNLVIIHRLLHSIHAARAAAVNAVRTCSCSVASSTVEKGGSTASKPLCSFVVVRKEAQ
jgi:hypothetical protein